ncbi:hypothetical protein Ahy_A09g045242 [Arachis hypogaea]|uniref:Protein FAR1-RELATED SEQUENCE n=1 Tax=Arachis hypogaea TaxID=3818 RepID=A0A445BLY3_ARAHY|nr:hypothetical protein Ahy_A09g045242 [Arachis hypogaea]
MTVKILIGDGRPYWKSTTLLGIHGWKKFTKLKQCGPIVSYENNFSSIKSLIRFYVNRKNTLIDFMHNLDWALKEYRKNELVADFKSQCSKLVMITFLEVYERFASNCFTCNIFKEIRNEIKKAEALNIKLLSMIVDKVEFGVTTLGDLMKDRRVKLDRCNNLFS